MYYAARGSSVYCSMLDATKAFDRVQYCKLFNSLCRRNLPLVYIRLLMNMYTNHVTSLGRQEKEPFSCPEFGLPLASGASRCSAPQPGTVYLPRCEPPNCRWAPSSACWRLSFSSTREPSSGAVVTEQRVRRRIKISGLNSTQLDSTRVSWNDICSRSFAVGNGVSRVEWLAPFCSVFILIVFWVHSEIPDLGAILATCFLPMLTLCCSPYSHNHASNVGSLW